MSSERSQLVSEAADLVLRSRSGTDAPDEAVIGHLSRAATISSVEESAPPSPTNGPAPNFAEVAPGVYRSSFPRPGNFEHLRTLGLRTILTLVPETYPMENIRFLKENGIRHFQIAIPAHKEPSDRIPIQNISKALELMLDCTNHPILVHCNKGKHRTGCIVACYRKLHDLALPKIIEEYRAFATTKSRALDEKFIQEFDETTIIEDLPKRMTRSMSSTASISVPISANLPTPPSSEKNESFREGSLKDFR
ncbi:hypothetical protein MMC25_005396 [Agyrium rufum]|nr:hypothetical protein [Agyrium rufum]